MRTPAEIAAASFALLFAVTAAAAADNPCDQPGESTRLGPSWSASRI